MKVIIEGLKRAKARTILSALVVLITTISICVVMSMPIGMSNGNAEIPQIDDTQINQQSEEQASAEDNDEAAVDDNAESDSDDAQQTDNGPQMMPNENGSDNMNGMRNGKGNGSNSTAYIIAAAIGAVGVILLIIINVSSTKKRKAEFSGMQENNVPLKAIKKQLFVEAFVVVLIVGIIGAGVGTAISQPISQAMMSASQAQMQQFDDSESGGRKMPEMPSGEAPSDDEMSTDMQDVQSENSDNENEKFDRTDSFDKDDRGNNKSNSLINLAVGAASAILMAIVSGLCCALPVKKAETHTIEEVQK